MARVAKPYTKIPLEKLDYIRLELRAKLKKLEAETGERYKIRTFYCGPRPIDRSRKRFYMTRPASTLKSNATAAKLAIYKLKPTYTGQLWPSLERYI